MNTGIDNPWLLGLLPMALIPWLVDEVRGALVPNVVGIPGDTVSRYVDIALRGVASMAIACLVLALAGFHVKQQEEQRVGEGAHIVLLIDRSLSMGQPFAGQNLRNPLDTEFKSKGQLARALISEFVADREQDLFGLVVFSTHPIPVLPLTEKQQFVQAAIEAGNIGRGLSQTNLAGGIKQALSFFEGRPFRGSRVVILVSDGAARIDTSDRARIRNLLTRYRSALYWIYLRSYNSPGLDTAGQSDKTLEQELHEFFSTTGTPYRVFSAENPDDLSRAIAQVKSLQNLPVRYAEQIPRVDLAPPLYVAAAIAILALAVAGFLEVPEWD